MASQWRIRHKLMLGLILVVGAMALLLGGTLRGLWSYYNTVNAIRGKMAEQKAAVAFKESVNALVEKSNLDRLAGLSEHQIGADPSVQDVRAALNAFNSDNLNSRRDATNSDHEQELIEQVLPEDIDRFEKAVRWQQGHPQQVTPGSEEDKEEDPKTLSRELVSIIGLTDFGSPGVFYTKTPLYNAWNARATKLHYSVRRSSAILVANARDLQDTLNKKLEDKLNESRRHYQLALWVIVPASILGLLVMIGLMRSFYSWIFNSIRDLDAGVRRVALGDFTRRIEVHSGDEMEDLAGAFNEMMQRLQDLYTDLARQVNERSRQLVRSEKLASVGFLAAGVAHEINNPLASIAFSSEALEARLKDLLRNGRGTDDFEVFTKYLRMIQEEAFRCKNITERLLAFSRTSERRREMTDLGQLIQGVLDITLHLPNAKGKTIEFFIAPDRTGNALVQAPVNAEEIKSVILNLVVNALDSMTEGGTLTVRLGQRSGMAELKFTDTGCGMTQDVLENIFEPFFTRSRTGKGTGLGLTISHGIITQHGGEIEAASAGLDCGSTFTVRLPLTLVEESPQPLEVRKPIRGLAA